MRKPILYRNLAVLFSFILISGLILDFTEPKQKFLYDVSSILVAGFALLWLNNRFLLISLILITLTQNIELLSNSFLGHVSIDILDSIEAQYVNGVGFIIGVIFLLLGVSSSEKLIKLSPTLKTRPEIVFVIIILYSVVFQMLLRVI